MLDWPGLKKFVDNLSAVGTFKRKSLERTKDQLVLRRENDLPWVTIH